jgi:hypothetical protein
LFADIKGSMEMRRISTPRRRASSSIRRVAERLAQTEHMRIAGSDRYRVKGQLLLTQDPTDTAEAERCFRTAIDVARGQGGEALRTARDDRGPPDAR